MAAKPKNQLRGPRPTLVRMVVKWGLIGGLIGLLGGALMGVIVGWWSRQSADSWNWVLDVTLDRGLFLGLIGLILGSAGGAIDWCLALRNERKKPSNSAKRGP
jgi:hypothetical protein